MSTLMRDQWQKVSYSKRSIVTVVQVSPLEYLYDVL